MIPPPDAPAAQQPPPVTRPRPRTGDPASAYLQALEALRRDGRWPRAGSETPAAHAARARANGLDLTALGRLASAYQLVRYGGRDLAGAEARRATPRLRAVRARLRR